MTQLINQFKQSTDQGQIDNPTGAAQVISCRVGAGQVTALVAGQAVKLDDSAGGIPNVLSLATDGDLTFGFVVLTAKDASYAAGAVVEIAISGTIMQMTASAAIARGAGVSVGNAAIKVAQTTGLNPVVGWAYDKAAADGDLIRVFITTPDIGTIAGLTKTTVVTATLAEINAGKTLIAGVAGRKIIVSNVIERVAGTFTTSTSVDVQSSNVTPVKVVVAAVAALGTGVVLTSAPTANVTLGAGFGVPLGTGDGVVVANVGTASAGGTSIQYTITYSIA